MSAARALFDELAEAIGFEAAKKALVVLNGQRLTLATVERDIAAERFRQLRFQGWPDGRAKSQRRMARECGVDAHTLRRWLRRSP